MNLMGNAALNRIAIKGLKDYSSLGETEKAQFIETFMAFISFSQSVASSRRCSEDVTFVHRYLQELGD